MAKKCAIRGCAQPSRKRGWCNKHYTRWRTHGDPTIRKNREQGPCLIKGCPSTSIGRGWCRKHYTRWRTYGDPLKVVSGPECPRVCKRCGNKGPFFARQRVCKKCHGMSGAKWREANKARDRKNNNEYARKRHQENRRLVLAAYGGSCRCCGEERSIFLAIDHVNGGGNKHRRALGNGKIAGSANYYGWLVRNRYPKGFQVLCHNCNFAKSHGGCPHQEEAA